MSVYMVTRKYTLSEEIRQYNLKVSRSIFLKFCNFAFIFSILWKIQPLKIIFFYSSENWIWVNKNNVSNVGTLTEKMRNFLVTLSVYFAHWGKHSWWGYPVILRCIKTGQIKQFILKFIFQWKNACKFLKSPLPLFASLHIMLLKYELYDNGKIDTS